MRKYEERDVVVESKTVCVYGECDSCGKPMTNLSQNSYNWEFCVVGEAGGWFRWGDNIDGKSDDEHLELCYECCMKISDAIHKGVFKSEKGK